MSKRASDWLAQAVEFDADFEPLREAISPLYGYYIPPLSK
jgi:hypothetical protein